jgi:two-component system chemotaxis response regulator CheB
MPTARIVAIGTSAGGIDALRAIVSRLPEDFPAPICVVMHTSAESGSLLNQILDRAGPLRAKAACDGERTQPGFVYVAPVDHHLLAEPGKLRVTKGPKENRFRPAIDPLFRSAAQVYGPAAIGVILTGGLDDGAAGLWAIKRLGGIAIVQDPADALFPEMPRSALAQVDADYTPRLAEIASLLVTIASAPIVAPDIADTPEHVDIEVKIAKEENALDAGLERVSTPSSFACPECHGVLLQLDEGKHTRFRCHTGHAYSADSLLAAIEDTIESALWSAARRLQEGGLLLHRMADHLARIHGVDTHQLSELGEEARRQSDAVRRIISMTESARATKT